MNAMIIEEQKDILALDTRRRIFDAIKEQPGICIRELERALDLALGELTYHLPILLKGELIKEENDGYFRRFFPVGINAKEMNIISALRRDSVKRVVPLILKNEKVTTQEISQILGISHSTAKWHLDRMEKNGLVNRKMIGRKHYFYFANIEGVKKIYCV